jgi:hypothetical protein
VITASGYSLHIVCDSGRNCPRLRTYLHPESLFAGPSKPDVMGQLRKAGWLLKRDGRTFCRVCRNNRLANG